MEISYRSMRLLNRLLRKPIGLASYRNVTGAAIKEEINTSLLTSYNQDIRSGGVVPVFRRALLFPTRVALQDEIGIYTYAGLYQAASTLCTEIATQLVGETEQTIAYMCGNDASHVIVQWAIWMSGNIAVPLSPLHPPEMLKYFLNDSMSSLIICTQDYEKILRPISLEISKPLLITSRDKEITAQLYQPDSAFLKAKEDVLVDNFRSNKWYGEVEALIIYTSGTTSKPKGVVWTHSMLQSQIASLHLAWQYSSNDVVLHCLPLHHIHGQLNSMLATLAAGARLRMLSGFAAHVVWARLVGAEAGAGARVTCVHGVPAMYARLADAHAHMFAEPRTAEYVRAALSRVRLMCAGSSALPVSLFNKWEEISGMRLLERYGMSEVGMALSNPYRPAEARAQGSVGTTLPGVSARVALNEGGRLRPLVTVDCPEPEVQISLERLGLPSCKDLEVESDRYDWKQPQVTEHEEAKDGVYQGELLLKGPGVFTRYWNRGPKVDSEEFTPDGWFRTGDTVSFSDGKFRILGRTSIDIIKTSGYKVSALQVESALLENPSIADAAVLGVPDEKCGQIVATVVVLKDNTKLTLQELKADAGKYLAPYQLPKTLLIIKEMPRNAMSKLDKKEIMRLYGKDLELKINS